MYTAISNEIGQIKELGYAGRISEAQALCEKLLTQFPKHPELLFYAGSLSLTTKKYEQAIHFFQNAIKADPKQIHSYLQLGLTYNEMAKPEEAIKSFEQALKLNDKQPEIHYNLAMALSQQKKYVRAEAHARKAIKLHSSHPLFHNALGNILFFQNKISEAVTQFQTAISIYPNYAESYFNLATLYRVKTKNHSLALELYQKAATIKPDYIAAHTQAALLANRLKRYNEALFHQQKKYELEQDSYVYYRDSISILQAQHKFEQVIDLCQQGLNIYPDRPALIDSICNACREMCDWTLLEGWQKKLFQVKDASFANNIPFVSYGYYYWDIPSNEKLIIARKISELEPARFKDKAFAPRSPEKNNPHKKIRVGYVTGDIRNHPTAHLIKNVFKYHDRKHFEVFLYSVGPDDDSPYREHIKKQVDHFVDLYEESEEEIANSIYKDQCDILIDINGYTEYSKTAIFSMRLAPIQINWLGFAGTLGADYIDYIVVDKLTIPTDHQQFYSEKPIYLPYTYFPVDNEQQTTAEYTRKEMNLPEDAFVFCCFNRHTKINLEVFQHWMSILKKIPNSVLWLFASNAQARKNIHATAQKYGISPDRIIFAESLPKEKHLGRIPLADLFLDTFHYTAHTTAIDALWCGVPLVTYLGRDMASRATGGALNAAGVPELITYSQEEYVEKIIYFATHPDELKKIREKIAANRSSAPLFNTASFVKWMEQGYKKAWESYLAGSKPSVIEVNN